MLFRPIAIVGRSCVLPGALNPGELWDVVSQGQDVTGSAPDGRWRLPFDQVLAPEASERAYHARGGYVTGFEKLFDPTGFRLAASEVENFDPLVKWVLHTAREALKQTQGYADSTRRVGAVLGNLSLPSESLSAFAENVTLSQQSGMASRGQTAEAAGVPKVNPGNRFMSGFPALLLARALGLTAGAMALDAACASSLYAIKLACDKLADGHADVMLAGAVNRADDLFLHMGFTALQALSLSGRSRPFHRDADGLLPAEGAAFVVLKRLEDAVREGDEILGVIRGVGLSNDGRATGLLVPDAPGQERALIAAYAQAGWAPSTVGMVECHATGTPIGDATEITTLSRVFAGCSDVPLGSLKGNLGHPITVAGLAGLLKILGAFEHGVRPPQMPVDHPNAALAGSPFRLLQRPEEWPEGVPRRAALSAFGFGGNNAHLLVEAWEPQAQGPLDAPAPQPPVGPLAVVGLGARVGDGEGLTDFIRTLFGETGPMKVARALELSARKLRFPPADLLAALPQQLWMLAVADEAITAVSAPARERIGVYVGMQCDASIARYGIRWRLDEWRRQWEEKGAAEPFSDAWLMQAKDQATPPLTAAGVLGTLPNVVANRLNSQFDWGGLGFAVSAEELSGVTALELACRALRARELDMALVGAVDMSAEPVQAAAAAACLPQGRHEPGDAAVALVVKRLSDAEAAGDPILAILPDPKAKFKADAELLMEPGLPSLSERFGHAHAASGLLHVAAAVASCRHRVLPHPTGPGRPLLLAAAPQVRVTLSGMAESAASLSISGAPKQLPVPVLLHNPPELLVYSGADREAVMQALASDCPNADGGPARMVVVAVDQRDRQKRLQKAMEWLRGMPSGEVTPPPPGEGLAYADAPVEGTVGALFGGAASAYPGMGRELFLAVPQLAEQLCRSFPDVEAAAGWMLDERHSALITPLQKLWGASALAQAHAHLTRHILGVPFGAALGLSSGETNALYAFEAWSDMGALRRDFEAAEVFTRHLGGRCERLQEAWAGMGVSHVGWSTWRVAASESEVRPFLADIPFVSLTAILGPRDVLIGGLPEACRKLISALGQRVAVALDYDVAVHTSELTSYAEAWHALHRRPTAPVPGIKFYTHATGSWYEPTAEKAADALLGQALKTLDFPALVESAYADGVRVFVEHGPQATLAPLVRQILGDRPHLAVSLDVNGQGALRQLALACAQLMAAGVPVQWHALADAWRAATEGSARPEPPLITFLAHRPAMSWPALPTSAGSLDTLVCDMPAPPSLPPVLQPLTLPPPRALAGPPSVSPPIGVPAVAHPAVSKDEDPGPVLPPKPIPHPSESDASTPVPPAPSSREINVPQPFPPQESPLPSVPTHSAETSPREASDEAMDSPLYATLLQAQRDSQEIFSRMLAQQAFIHQQYLAQSTAAWQAWLQRHQAGAPGGNAPGAALSRAASGVAPIPHVGSRLEDTPGAAPVASVAPVPVPPASVVSPQAPVAPSSPPVSVPSPETQKRVAPSPLAAPTPEPAAPPATKLAADALPVATASKPNQALVPLASPKAELGPVGPTFDRKQLEILASGKISDVFGPLFSQQDQFHRQVRMPEPPLLLADRVTGLRGEAGSMKTGTIWTETDVRWDCWYLHQGRMPAGIMVESGQADLLMISWLGADFLNRGERVYRLLGCELTYHANPENGYEVLPKPGETLAYDIHVDGHAKQGDVRLFFFHYDCRIGGHSRLSVRHGQAGFFTDEELAGSAGVLWDPLEAVPEGGRVDAPRALTSKRRFETAEIEAFAEGHMLEAFGAGFEAALSHVRSPRMSGSAMRFFDTITEFDPTGGPWGRGYLRATAEVTPDAWYFKGHFKNDPCMPGTLMFEGTLQTMAFYLSALGFALNKDGWRFEPVPEATYLMRCRGQVTPASRHLVYEVFVEEVHDGEYPTLWADLLVTVDGLKAFHCRRMGVRLVPGFPIEAQQERLEVVDTKAVAQQEGFAFGQRSLWACAWGRPSMAFGPQFKGFDAGKRLPRLPGPPYHFMTRIASIDGQLGDPRVGSTIVAEYDVPPDAWYFEENGSATMPFAVLLEAALQPCGWLASFVGTPLRSETELFFRNLDGTSTLYREITPEDGTLVTEVTLTKSAQSAGMVIVGFEVRCRLPALSDDLVFEMSTVFGFFPGAALASQVGIPPTAEEAAVLVTPSDFKVDLARETRRYARPALAIERLRLLDRITGWWPTGGRAGLGRMRAEKDVDPSHWYFKAHFFQDPVQPGSLGLEAMLQVLQMAMAESGMAQGVSNPRFESIGLDLPLTWKYRGQVVPTARTVVVEVELTASGVDDRGPYAVADAWLWVDGMRIYGAQGLGMRIVSEDTAATAEVSGFDERTADAPAYEQADALSDESAEDATNERAEDPADEPAPDSPPAPDEPPAPPEPQFVSTAPPMGPDDEELDPAVDVWLQDHKPTYVLPVLPFMSLLDRIVGAARATRPQDHVVRLTDVQVHKWVALPGGVLRLRRKVEPLPDGTLNVTIERWWDAPNPAFSRFEPVATGKVEMAAEWPECPAAWLPPDDAEPQPDPYSAGEMFHGPAFQVLRSLALGSYGATAWLDAESDAPVGFMNQVLLDGLTHAIPSADLRRWSTEIAEDQVGYPSKVLSMTVFGPTPTRGSVRCEVRYTGFFEAPRFPRFDIQLITEDRVWLNLELVYILFPKGPLGEASGPERLAFLGEKTAVPNMGLARADGDTTRLSPKEVRGSDWLPGTLARIYEAEGDVDALTKQIAAKEHIGSRMGVHPSDVELSDDGTAARVPQAPLTRVKVDMAVTADGEVAVSDAGPPGLDITPVREYWRDRLQMGAWPGEDLYYGLAERYVNSVELEDPDAYMYMHGRGALYLANHQVGIESLLFSLIVSALGGVPTGTLAKKEHMDSWLGRLIAHHFAYPGVIDPELIMFFDRQDPASLPGILANLQPRLALDEKSLLVHVDGTRSLQANQPVQQISAALIDLALEAEAPIVPVRFSGGLPLKAGRDRLEFPLGHGKQTYHIGRPIWPDDLLAVGLAERKRIILAGINALGPAAGEEQPTRPDDDFAAEIAGWCARMQVGEIPAVMFKTLEHLSEPTPETAALMAAIRKAKGKKPLSGLPDGPWFATLADWLAGRSDALEVPGAMGGMNV